MNEYVVYITVTEKYIVEAANQEEALEMASCGQAGDPYERWDNETEVVPVLQV